MKPQTLKSNIDLVFESWIWQSQTSYIQSCPLLDLHSQVVELSWRELVIQTKTICWMPKHPIIQTFIMLTSTRFIQWNCFFPNTPWFSASQHLLELFPAMGIPSLHSHACLNSILPLKNSSQRLPSKKLTPATLIPLLYSSFNLGSAVSPSFMVINLIMSCAIACIIILDC